MRHLPRRRALRLKNRYRPDAVRRGLGSVDPAAFQGSTTLADHKKLDVTWDAATLDKYLANPRAMVPDTSMIYAGLKDNAERADLVAYIATLH